MNLKQKTVMCIATGCYIGKLPFAPGTFGTFPGLFFCFIISGFDIWFAFFFTLVLVIFAIWASHEAEKILNQNDPRCIVIDEIAGMGVTLLGLPFNAFSAITGFFIFRFFDILKPFPIRFLEKKVSGGTGVVLDDILAGIAGNLTLRIIYNFIECPG